MKDKHTDHNIERLTDEPKNPVAGRPRHDYWCHDCDVGFTEVL